MKKFLRTTLFSVTIFSTSLLAQSSSDIRPEVDPYTFIQTGKYEISGIDKGDYSGFGLGGRIGVRLPSFWIGFDATLVKPNFDPESNISQTLRDQHPLPDNEELISYGAGIGFKLSSMHIYYTYYIDQQIKGKLFDRTTSRNVDFTYRGKGQKYGISYEPIENFNIFIEKFESNLNRYSAGASNGLPAYSKSSISDFSIDSWSIGLSFKIRFSQFGSLIR